MSICGHFVFQRNNLETGDWVTLEVKLRTPRNYLLYAALGNPQCISTNQAHGSEGPFIATVLINADGLPEDVVVNEQGYLRDRALTDIEMDDETIPWLGDYSYGWCFSATLLKLMESSKVVTEECILTRKAYDAWDKSTEPECYSYRVGGSGVVLVKDDPFAMEKCPDWNHVSVTWRSALKDHAEFFYEAVKSLDEAHAGVRILYGFTT